MLSNIRCDYDAEIQLGRENLPQSFVASGKKWKQWRRFFILFSSRPPSILPPVMAAVLRDEPLCPSLSSALTLRGYC